MKLCIPILKSINDPFFFIRMNDYLEFIDNFEDNQSTCYKRMKILQQNLVPYFNLTTKKITLFWNINDIGS